MIDVTITEYSSADFEALLNMSVDLYHDYSAEETERDLVAFEDKSNYKTYMAKLSGEAIGFITVSIRSDYVEGAKSSPVGYLEAIYVYPEFRKKGIAKQLYEKGESWVHQNGCTEIGSNTWDWNTDSQKFHSKLGFNKEDILVHYIKAIEKR